MAAPHVSGVAALIVGKFGHMNPSQLKQGSSSPPTTSSRPAPDAGSGKGRVNALECV